MKRKVEGKTKKNNKVSKQYTVDHSIENYCEKENNLFFKKLCCFFTHML